VHEANVRVGTQVSSRDPTLDHRSQVNGDRAREPNETFAVDLARATGNAAIADGHAVGTIVDDDRARAKLKRVTRHR
jgi:hypothetical protein